MQQVKSIAHLSMQVAEYVVYTHTASVKNKAPGKTISDTNTNRVNHNEPSPLPAADTNVSTNQQSTVVMLQISEVHPP